MSSVADLALSTILQAQRRVEVAAQNLANVTTSGYKRRVAFSTLLRGDGSNLNPTPNVELVIDFRPGKISNTGNPTDLAIAGPGYFSLRSAHGVLYSRQGQLSLNREGRLVNAQGDALQLTNGNDLIVNSSAFRVQSDGTVFENGVSIGRIAVFVPHNEKALEVTVGGFRAGDAVFGLADNSAVQQGMIETANISTGDEMVGMMEALRRAESGQRIMNAYDDLMGRVITSFGDAVR
jgi:flagellar basal-body rod protein FlgF